MDPVDAAFIKAVVVGLFLAGTSLSAYWLHLRHRTPRAPELEHELEQLRGRVAELEERVDFTERRLVAERNEPRETTPV